MEIRNLKRFVVIAIFMTIQLNAVAQQQDWRLQEGKALAEDKLFLSNQSAEAIYKNLNRWLVSYFENPEENIRARVPGEYIRGTANIREFIKGGQFSPSDLTYTFVAKVYDNEVTLTLTDAKLIYHGSQDADVDPGSVQPIEQFFTEGNPRKKGKKSNDEKQKIAAALNNFSKSFFQSFRTSLSDHDQ